ncbi:omptin family outer membrane protease [Winslowiella sp. 2C04]|uniref:omptin family outer membrane protease n=1 Tax=Winslowiella sp. 2C04 TaxID=3416179 RepID=UPI003CE69AAB
MTVKGIAVSGLLLAGNACAEDNNWKINTRADSVSVASSLGWLGGRAQESVYASSGGDKVSQLDWKIHNAAIIKADISWDALPWLTANAGGWTTLTSGKGHMVDRDWMDSRQSDPTHYSWHPNTSLNYANEFDLNLKSWLLKGESYRLGPIIGYQQSRFSWTSSGGKYRYYNGLVSGSFPQNRPVIGYQQKFTTPYIGLAGQYRASNVELTTLLKYSNWVKSSDNDEHYLRKLTFRDSSKRSGYYSLLVDAGYYLLPNIKLYTELSYNRYQEGKGGTEIIDRSTGQTHQMKGDVAGLANTYYTALVGVKYTF